MMSRIDGVEAAGRVDLQHDELGVVLLRAREAAHDEVGAGRSDRAVDRQHDDRRRLGTCADGAERKRCDRDDSQDLHHLHAMPRGIRYGQ